MLPNELPDTFVRDLEAMTLNRLDIIHEVFGRIIRRRGRRSRALQVRASTNHRKGISQFYLQLLDRLFGCYGSVNDVILLGLNMVNCALPGLDGILGPSELLY